MLDRLFQSTTTISGMQSIPEWVPKQSLGTRESTTTISGMQSIPKWIPKQSFGNQRNYVGMQKLFNIFNQFKKSDFLEKSDWNEFLFKKFISHAQRQTHRFAPT
jgi:hypothetical protein